MKTERQFLTLTILSFFVTLVWTAVHFYDQYTQSTVSATLKQQIAPIAPTFDLTTLRAINNRHNVTPLYQANFSSSGPEAATTSASLSSTPAVSAQPSLGLPTTGSTQTPAVPFPSTFQLPISSAGGVLR